MKRDPQMFTVMVKEGGRWQHTQWIPEAAGGTFANQRTARAAIKKATKAYPNGKYKLVKLTLEDAQ